MKRKEIYEEIEYYHKEVTRLEHDIEFENDEFVKMRTRVELMAAREKLHEYIDKLKEEEFSSKIKRGCKKAWELFVRFII